MAATKLKNIDGSISSASLPEDTEEFSLDAILVQIGQFGKFQLRTFLLISVPMLFNAIFSISYVFTASTVVHRCFINECDSDSSSYNEPWVEFTIPMNGKNLDQCHSYTRNLSENNTFSKINSLDINSCSNFNQNLKKKCQTDNLIFFNNEKTISNDFSIYCSDQWKLNLVGTINNFGQFIGIPLGGFISDKYGRRVALALGGFLSAVFGILRSFSPSYTTFLLLEFLDNVANSTLYPTCFIIGMELVGPKKRVIACSLITIFYAIGEILLAFFAKLTQNWRVLLQILYIPALLQIVYFWVLPESVRWLLGQGREEEAKNILKHAAKVNKRIIMDNTLDIVIHENREKLSKCTEKKFPIKKAFTALFWRIANCSFCWIVNVLVYFGLSLNAVLLNGNKYNNFIFLAVVEIPGFLLPYLTMDRIGRRFSLFGFMLISGFCCLGMTLVKREQEELQLTLFLLGKLSITASFQVLYFFTSEIFPTNIRNSLLSFCSMMGRLGSMLAPQTPLLAKYNENLPAIVFATASFLSAILSLFFPETTNLVLPTNIKEATNIRTK